MAAAAVILIVDDEVSERSRISSLLAGCACRVETVSSGPAALQRIQQTPFPDLVLLDTAMPGMDGLETLRRLRDARPELRIVMLAASDEPQKIVRSVRLGAEDCLPKLCDRRSILAVLRNAPGAVGGGGAPELRGAAERTTGGSLFVAASPAMRRLHGLVAEVAPTDIPVLCIGESGTGKEVVARLLHALSRRSRHTFLKVNCAALPGELLESELFGYEQGAFTGAVRSKPGKFELCSRGTILLDEFGEIPPQLQAKLLHVLQDGEFTRLGGRLRIKADVRVVAATNVDIREALVAKRLREDLYYRLSAVVFEIPPLRERREEIPLLLQHFLEKYGGQSGLPIRRASPAVMEFATRHDWPGNVRELENFVKRYLALGEQALAGGSGSYLHSNGTAREPHACGGNGTAQCALRSHVSNVKHHAEVSAIVQALHQTNWNRKEAARLLQVSYKTLLCKIRLYSLDSTAPQLNCR